jgi:hypothetical protein
MLDCLLPILEKEGWSHAQIAADWGISLTTLIGHLSQEVSMLSKHDYEALTEELERRLSSGEARPAIQADFEARGVHWRTFMNRRSQLNKAHRSTPEEHHNTEKVYQSTPEKPELWTEHQSTPEPTESLEHPGTLEGHQEVIEDVSESVPDAPHISPERAPEHPSTPIAHAEVSAEDSTLAHLGVPARQEHHISTPMVHPGTPTEEDWELWTAIKARWLEVEKMLADRQALLSTPRGTPGHTQKKTYVFDSQHIALIDRYAQEHRLDLKDVLYQALEEFFHQRGYVQR